MHRFQLCQRFFNLAWMPEQFTRGLRKNSFLGSAPAIGNAVADAARIRTNEIPYRWRDVHRALRGGERFVA